jgi:hypothetical protein
MMFSLGTQFGIPLTSMRRVSLLLGPRISYLTDLEETKVLMGGIRAGLNYRKGIGKTGDTLWGFHAGLHGELGGLKNFGSPKSESLFPGKDIGTYVEGGANIGISLDSRLFVGAEAAIGRISSAGTDIDTFRVGFSVGVSL